MKREEVLRCSFPAWYDAFAKVTFASVVVNIPQEVLLYLKTKGSLVLPKECDGDWAQNKDGQNQSDEDDEEPKTDWSVNNEEEEEEESPTFPEFTAKLKEAFKELGGQVFCKLNWSSPRDATWVSFGNSLKCSDLSQLFLLLKSSDFIRHDLVMPFQDCEDSKDAPEDFKHVLVLRQWNEINPSHEFRCFVSQNQLVAVCQRDATAFYSHIGSEKQNILTDIRSFYEEQIRSKFPLDSYVFDIVRRAKDDVALVDFNPFGPPTDGILFSWEELRDVGGTFNEQQEMEFRFVEDETGIQPNGLGQYSVPVDMVHLSTGQDPHKLIDFLKLQQTQQAKDDDSK